MGHVAWHPEPPCRCACSIVRNPWMITLPSTGAGGWRLEPYRPVHRIGSTECHLLKSKSFHKNGWLKERARNAITAPFPQ